VPFCPNPECPYRKRVGKPAEYLEEYTECSDCGSPLSKEIIEEINFQERPSNDFLKRVFYTIAIIIIWKVIALIPAPGINSEAFQDFLSGNMAVPSTASTTISIFALGLMPYLAAYVIIEIFSLFLPPLKSWRAQGYAGRKKIKTVALVATIFLALLQGYNLALGIEGMSQGELVRNPGLGFRLMMALTLTAGTFIAVLIAELITKKGVGHGISVMIFTGIGARLFSNFSGIEKISEDYSPFGFYIILLILIIASIVFIILFERSQRKIPVKYNDGVKAYLPLKVTTAGIVPALFATSLIFFPATVASFVNIPWVMDIASKLSPGTLVYTIVLALAIFFFYYFLTALFYNPTKLITFLKNRNAEIVTPNGIAVEHYIDKSLSTLAFVGALYLCIIVCMQDITFLLFWFFVGGVNLIVASAIVLDLLDEVRMRKKGESFVQVAELHDIPIAGLLKSVLEQKGITCYLRGYYHRALLYFFGPYIEVSVLVPEGKVMDAQEVINNYIDPKVIVKYHRA
jgi:preprotein translocase subunit SecY